MRQIETFFALNPIFTVNQAKSYLKNHKGLISKILYHHNKKGRIILIRRGLYYVVPPGATAENCPVDAYLIASKMSEDAILAYHTALGLHGNAHSVRYELQFMTKSRPKKPFVFRDYIFHAVSIPSALVKVKKNHFGVMTIERLGVKIAVTTLERTFVDMLDRPHLTGSWEEIWKSFESIEYLDINQVIEYALLLSNRLTITKVGFFLDSHRDQFRVTDSQLKILHEHSLQRPRYLERNPKGPQKLIHAWNLIVPMALHERNWEEPYGDF